MVKSLKEKGFIITGTVYGDGVDFVRQIMDDFYEAFNYFSDYHKPLTHLKKEDFIQLQQMKFRIENVNKTIKELNFQSEKVKKFFDLSYTVVD